MRNGKAKNRYSVIIEKIFFNYYKPGIKEFSFDRQEIIQTAKKLKIELPKNIGDILYSFRYRANLPETIVTTASEGLSWIIRPVGQAKYKFCLVSLPRILPSSLLSETKIPDSTPGIISKYALNDEQGLLAKLRYNRLIDIFTGVTCYSLQNHLRTNIEGVGQVETDELYVGIDQRGIQYIIPVQAKGGTDKIGIVQIEQDFLMCENKFQDLVCKPIAAQFIENNKIALFLFEKTDQNISVSMEKHYRLVNPDEVSKEELLMYRTRLNEK